MFSKVCYNTAFQEVTFNCASVTPVLDEEEVSIVYLQFVLSSVPLICSHKWNNFFFFKSLHDSTTQMASRDLISFYSLFRQMLCCIRHGIIVTITNFLHTRRSLWYVFYVTSMIIYYCKRGYNFIMSVQSALTLVSANIQWQRQILWYRCVT